MKNEKLTHIHKGRTLKIKAFTLIIVLFAVCTFAHASESKTTTSTEEIIPITFLWIVVILVGTKLLASACERIGQPAVLGELVAGVIFGNLTILGIYIFEPLRDNYFINFLAEFGVVILLFQIGLESNLQEMRKVGVRAFLVACVGVIVPFVLGTWVIGPLLLGNMPFSSHLFLGATLTATSVGITARVFQDLKKLATREAKIVLGAAIIDDVLGLIILAVVSAIVVVGSVSIGDISWITAKAVLFLVGSIVIGQLIAKPLGRFFSKIHRGIAMKFTLAIGFGLIFAYLSKQIGLAPIVGAFAAGLILDPVHFEDFESPAMVNDLKEIANNVEHPDRKLEMNELADHHANHHIEELIKPLAYIMVPIFFFISGFRVQLDALLDSSILLIALGIVAAAFVGKIVAGIVAGKVNKLVVGFGMIPRGEVGLIFAVMGRSLGVVNDKIYAAIVIMIILSTLLTPPILAVLLRRGKTTPITE